jgi:PKD repeat protein
VIARDGNRVVGPRLRVLLAALVAAAAVCAAGGTPPGRAATLPSGFQETVVLSGLVNPTVIRFAADGRVFVAEKSGLVKVFDNLADTTPTTFVDLRTNVHNFWDRGLLGLALAPTFPADPSVYVLYTYDAAIGGVAPRWGTVGGTADGCPTPPGATADGCVVSGRLSRFQAAGNVAGGPEQVLLEDWCQQYPSHSVGSLEFGADGALYVSGGDGASFNFTDWGQDGSPGNPCGDPPGGNNLNPPSAEGGALRSQDVRTTSDPAGLNGAVLRLNPATGAGLPDNPLAFSSDPNTRRIIAYGFRNPFRIGIRPGTNEVWTGDVGWNDWEEIDLVQNQADGAADNYGWPCYEGNGRQSGYDSANLNLCETLYSQGGVVTPYYTYNHSATVAPTGDTCPTGSSSISGFAFESGPNFPSLYDGATFFADYSRDCIWVMRAGADGRPDVSTRQMFAGAAANPVDLEFGPDGALYYADFDGGTIRRIAAIGSDSTPPTVSLTSPSQGATVTGTVTVSASASDNSGTVAGVQFRLDGADLGAEDTGAPFQLSWDSRTAANGSHTLTAVARDPTGNTATSAPVTITVSNSGGPPPAGLVAALGFDEGSGATTADASGAGNSGSISGASWNASGRYGWALSYDGSNDWVTVAGSASLDLSSGMTLEAWVRPTALGQWRTVLLREQTGFYTYALYADTGSGQPSGNAVVGGNDSDVRAPTPVPLNAWTHLAATYDGAAVTLYVNGAQAGQQPAAGAIASGTGPLRIGGNAIWPEWFQGLIDEVRIYNRALTPSEIQSDMTRPITNADGQPPGPPGTLTATGSLGAVSLAWGAASDNTGVVRYNVHRGTSAGFTPSAANRIAQPTATSYVDTGLAAGTYYYRVTAEDAAGNVGEPSNEASAAALADTQAPTATITAPAGGATVSGTVQVTANATDNGSVAGVQFRLDGGTLGAEDTTSPYAVDWSTVTATNGSHTLTAVARDGAGNATTSAPVTVTVSNTAPTGLVAAYAFDETAGTTAADASGSGNTGSLSGATFTTAGRNGGAVSFDGVNDWVTVADANSLDLTSAMTLEAWINPSALGTAWRTVVFKEQVGNLTYGLYANRNTTRPNAQVYVAGADRNVDGSAALPLNAWTHLAATYDGATLRLYVGGTQVAQLAQTGPIATSTGALRIGGNNIWSEWFAGRIDDVRLYNRALTPAQIQTDMNTPVGGGTQNTPPQVTITSPTAGTTWKVDDVITFAASGTDAQDGTLPPAAFDWVVLIQHCPSNCHSHTYQSFDDVAGGSFPAPDHEYPSHLELRVTATDASGATATATLPLQPQTVDLTFATSPPGLQLTVGPTTGTASFTRTVIVGSTNSISAPTPQTLGGTSYAFSSWSDGGAQTHTIVAPAAPATITATYQSDPNAPTVGITSPGAGATVSGSVGVAATADDDVGVVGVRFTLDGAALGSEDTTAPYQVTWNTTAAANGPHTLRAIARDGAGNETTSAAVAVTVANNHAPTAVATGTPLTGPAPLTVAFDGSGSSDPDAGDSLSYAWDLDGDGQFDDSTAVAPSFPYTVPGTVSVRLRVTDGGGLAATSPPLTVTVTPARPSPVAAYGFEETSGTTVTDKSGNGNSGVISGATRITTGHTGRALSFDGVNDWVTVGDAASLDLTAGMTLEAWVYPTSLGNANRAVIVKEGSTASVYALSAHRSANPRRPTGSADVAGQRVVVGASQLSTSTWFHLAVTYDGTALRLYVDGTLSASLPVTGSITTSSGVLRLGGTALGAQWFRGRLDDVRVYASALTQVQIQEDMAAAVPA